MIPRTLDALFCQRQKERTTDELRRYVEAKRASGKQQRKRIAAQDFQQTGESSASI